mgnify:CR=1 FL=1
MSTLFDIYNDKISDKIKNLIIDRINREKIEM